MLTLNIHYAVLFDIPVRTQSLQKHSVSVRVSEQKYVHLNRDVRKMGPFIYQSRKKWVNHIEYLAALEKHAHPHYIFGSEIGSYIEFP